MWISTTAIAVGMLMLGTALALAYRQAWLGAHSVVPSLIGDTVQAAGNAVIPLDLGVKVTAQRQDPRAAFGEVVAQDPPAGREVIKGTIVNLTISEGSGTVPYIEGKPVAEVVRLLEAAGLRLGTVTYTRDDQIRAGVVIHQFETSGTNLGANSAVDVLVSAGAAIRPVPNASPGGPVTPTPAPPGPFTPSPQPQLYGDPPVPPGGPAPRDIPPALVPQAR